MWPPYFRREEDAVPVGGEGRLPTLTGPPSWVAQRRGGKKKGGEGEGKNQAVRFFSSEVKRFRPGGEKEGTRQSSLNNNTVIIKG